MTMARSQRFCKALNINLGYYNGSEIYPRINTEKDVVY